jgi:hypothetical protein
MMVHGVGMQGDTQATEDEEPRTREDVQAALVSDLTGIVREVLELPERQAAEVAARLFWAMRKAWGGRRVRFYSAKSEELRAQARAMFTGANALSVCQELGISRSRFYELISKDGRRRERKGQKPE